MTYNSKDTFKNVLYLVCHAFLIPIAEIIILIFHLLLVTSNWILSRDSILGFFYKYIPNNIFSCNSEFITGSTYMARKVRMIQF